jgi:hypothetical protein
MKKLLFAVFFALAANIVPAQSDIYSKLIKIVKETHPEISLSDKLIAFNVWSLNDAESRQANKDFEKTYNVYQNARLKGGLRGIVVLAVNQDNLSSEAVIALTKDGITKMISVKHTDIADLEPGIKNRVFDSAGAEVYRDLPASTIYSSINHLITR